MHHDNGESYSTDPIIWPSILSDVLCRNARFYQQLSQRVAKCSEGLNSTETALADEQQREVTTADVLLFRHLRDHAEKKWEEAQKKILLPTS